MTPQRTREHEVGSQAVTAVSALISRAGHAVEPVINDYGEDLLVQTSHAGNMDASRLWIQVKGTDDCERFRLKGGDFSLSVPFGHALRWSRSTDSVAIVLWDVLRACGWYTWPSLRVDQVRDGEAVPRTTTLRFDANGMFDLAAIDRLVWGSRINHYRLLALSALDFMMDVELTGDQGWAQRRTMVMIGFALLIGVFEEHPSEPGAFWVNDEVRDIFAENLDSEITDVKDAVYIAAFRTVSACLQRKIEGVGLPRVLIGETAEALIAALGLKQMVEAQT